MPKGKQTHPRQGERPHDAVFKAFFGDAKIAKSYLMNYTPADIQEKIDFSSFRRSDTAFVSGRFGVSFSDVVYETQLPGGGLARLLYLFEHKSYIPKQPIHLQLLDYLLQIWEDDLKNDRPLSFVIPIVVYHGRQKWPQRSLSAYLGNFPTAWQVFIPDFSYLLTDLGRIQQQTIINASEDEHLSNLFLALKSAHDGKMVRKN
ncbi:MAG: Rpn family recombination-promoting nuclease/putative transposase [Saprospiraceae bacterium]|nr:Rpn family recombination-promoting nuclease/putative transposase [Saprospiraceae bacterium]